MKPTLLIALVLLAVMACEKDRYGKTLEEILADTELNYTDGSVGAETSSRFFVRNGYGVEVRLPIHRFALYRCFL